MCLKGRKENDGKKSLYYINMTNTKRKTNYSQVRKKRQKKQKQRENIFDKITRPRKKNKLNNKK